jgi:hypothetical protein
MVRARFGRAARLVILTGSVLASLGCGGGGDSSGPDTASPVIRRFQIARLNSVTFGTVLDVFDAQADVFGGTCRVIVDGAGTLDIPINQLLPGADPNDPEEDVVCAVRLRQAPPRGLTVTGRISVIDRAGHQSNAMEFVLTFEARRDGAADQGGRIVLDGGQAEMQRARW